MIDEDKGPHTTCIYEEHYIDMQGQNPHKRGLLLKLFITV
jgi:hypothetical protein